MRVLVVLCCVGCVVFWLGGLLGGRGKEIG